MGINRVYSPGHLWSGNSPTQYVPNPWGTAKNPSSNVWIECAINGLEIWDTSALAAFGIIEYEFVDNDGNAQQKSFGDINNLSGIYPDQLPTRLFINKFLSVTVAFISYNVDGAGEVSIYDWG